MNEQTEKFTPTSDPRTIEVNKICRVPEGVTRLSEVQATDTQWLWKPYIPRGKITLITADPGVGKTFLALYLTAQVSSGDPFYGEPEDAFRQPDFAVFQSAEDGFADTIKPRLTPMLPDFSHILNIDETINPLTLLDERIGKIMYECQPALMVFDPLQAYLGAEVDMHRANAVRPILAHVSRLAEMYNTAVVFIMHNSKMQGNKALYRALGSIDIAAVARSTSCFGSGGLWSSARWRSLLRSGISECQLSPPQKIL
ncbi:MAG: AAA family ATPase [Ruminococcus sp.]|nr:AAA family ATPase [Ruminococcus sp.]